MFWLKGNNYLIFLKPNKKIQSIYMYDMYIYKFILCNAKVHCKHFTVVYTMLHTLQIIINSADITKGNSYVVKTNCCYRTDK